MVHVVNEIRVLAWLVPAIEGVATDPSAEEKAAVAGLLKAYPGCTFHATGESEGFGECELTGTLGEREKIVILGSD